MNKKNDTPKENVMYVKLSIYFRKYIESKYGKSPVCFPLLSPMYSCIERYIVNNYNLSPISALSFSEYAFNYKGDNGLYENCNVSVPSEEDKANFLAIVIPGQVFRIGSLIKTSNNWQLSYQGAIEFKKLIRREFWIECIKFIDDCFHAARLQHFSVTRENAISDFLVAYNIPMTSYESILRSERRARIELRSEIENRRNWMETLNDTALTYT